MEVQELEYLSAVAYKICLYRECPIKRIFKGVTKAEYKRCKEIIEEYKAKYGFPDFVWEHSFLYLTCKDIKEGKVKTVEEAIKQYEEEVKRFIEQTENKI